MIPHPLVFLKSPVRVLQLTVLLLSIIGVNACKKSGPDSGWTDSDVQIRPDPTSAPKSTPDPATGFLTETFDLPVHKALEWLESASPEDPVVMLRKAHDPFGSSPKPPHPSGPVHHAFAAIGIPFPPGSSASYDPGAGKLTIVQTPEAVGLIRHILAQFQEIPDTAAVRFEFYEVPSLLALRLEQSAAAHFDGTPEWDALQGLFGESGIRLLEVATMQSISGQRAKFEDGEVVVYRSGTKEEMKDGKNEAVELFDQRLVGTIIETDLIIGEDGHTMDLNLALEYHSAPPERISTTSDPESSDSPPTTIFHLKKLITQITIHDGETRLLTSWTPTGKPEFADNDRRILVFVSANLQREN